VHKEHRVFKAPLDYKELSELKAQQEPLELQAHKVQLVLKDLPELKAYKDVKVQLVFKV
jgi:hypothetical protein